VAALTTTLISLPKRSGPLYIPPWLLHLAMHVWLGIFIAQPHKEERFLFPAYPLICLAAASTLDYVQKLFFHIFIRIKSKHYLDHTNFISIGKFYLKEHTSDGSSVNCVLPSFK
jgi:alpha-1,2-mannosyltransferase